MMINVVHWLKVVFTVTKVKKNYTVVEFKGVLHLLTKINMFCALSQNNQQLFEK